MSKAKKKLKKTKTNDKSKKKKKELAAEIQAEKEVQAHDKMLTDIAEGDYSLKKVETVDKTKLPEKSELAGRIKDEKAAAKIDEQQSKILSDVVKDQKLKHTETKEKSLTNLSKDELIALIKAERDAHKAEEAANRANVLADIPEAGKKLKKTQTNDKTKAKKKDLAKQIKDEKEANAADEAHGKLLADVAKDQKLKSTTTVDKSQLPSKDEMKAQIKAEKQEQKREAEFTQVLTDISERDYHLKKTDTVDKSNLTKKSKKEQKAIIKAEKEAYKAQEQDDRAKVLTDVTKDQKLKKTETVDKSKLPEKKRNGCSNQRRKAGQGSRGRT